MGKTLLTPRQSLNAFSRSPSQLNVRTGGSQQGLMPLLLVVVYTKTVISTWVQPCAFKATYPNNTRLQEINLLLSESSKCHADYSGTCSWGIKKLQTLSLGTTSKTLRHDNKRFCKLGLLRVKRTKMNLKCSCFVLPSHPLKCWPNSVQML